MIDRARQMKRLLDHTSERELFIHPYGWPAAYLAAGANPTRRDMVFPKYQSDEELQGVIDSLEHSRPRCS